MYSRVPHGDARAPFSDVDNSIELRSAGHGNYAEERIGHSSEDFRNASLGAERDAFVTPSISDMSEQRTLAPASVFGTSLPSPEPQSFRNEDSHILHEETSYQKERAADPNNTEAVKESVWAVWWTEIFSSFLSLGCIIAVVIILFVHQGLPLPSWPKLISINTLISVFAAVFKASLIFPVAEGLGQLKWNWFDRPQRLGDLVLFDNASRGPWGSFLLMLKYLPRPGKGYLAVFGALITVAALAIDPFFQAMITHLPCETTAQFGQAQVSRTNNYSGNPLLELHYYTGGEITVLNPQMTKAINRGLVDPPKAGELIDFSCTSGNCTFEQDTDSSYFSSLGVCYSCDDVSDQVVKASAQGSRGSNMTVWYLPWSRDTLMERVFQALPGQLLTLVPSPTYENSSSTIYSFDVLALNSPECKECGSIGNQTKPFAAQCRIEACVKGYSAKVSNGLYTEKEYGDGMILSRRPGTTSGADNETDLALFTDSITVDGTERRCEEVTDGTNNTVRVGFKNGVFQEIATDRIEVYPPQDLIWKSYPQECVWVIDRSSWRGMKATIAELLEGEITQPSSFFQDYDYVKGTLWNKRLFAAGNASIATVNDMVAGLAASMTATMRNSPYGSSEELANDAPTDLKATTGRVVAVETCIYVGWGWIAYPAALLLLQWIFSALVLIACSRGLRAKSAHPVRPVWKSSPLALLFHGLDEDLRSKTHATSTVKQMDGAANDIKVHLVPTDGSKRNGWRFTDI